MFLAGFIAGLIVGAVGGMLGTLGELDRAEKALVKRKNRRRNGST